MSNADGYIQEINSITDEICRINKRLLMLRKQRNEARKRLYYFMIKNNMEKYKNITLKSIEPKSVQRKTESQKRMDAIKFLESKGIENPEDFFMEFKSTQKMNQGDLIEKKEKKIKKKDTYDPMLGF